MLSNILFYLFLLNHRIKLNIRVKFQEHGVLMKKLITRYKCNLTVEIIWHSSRDFDKKIVVRSRVRISCHLRAKW